jgi:hypothetical protein
MAYDYVTVGISLATLDTTPPSGKLVFEVSDFVLDTTTGAIVIVPSIVLTSSGGFSGNPQNIQFLAMDSNSLSHNWSWVLSADLAGRMTKLPKRQFSILIANGATQPFVALAGASTVIA